MSTIPVNFFTGARPDAMPRPAPADGDHAQRVCIRCIGVAHPRFAKHCKKGISQHAWKRSADASTTRRVRSHASHHADSHPCWRSSRADDRHPVLASHKPICAKTARTFPAVATPIRGDADASLAADTRSTKRPSHLRRIGENTYADRHRARSGPRAWDRTSHAIGADAPIATTTRQRIRRRARQRIQPPPETTMPARLPGRHRVHRTLTARRSGCRAGLNGLRLPAVRRSRRDRAGR